MRRHGDALMQRLAQQASAAEGVVTSPLLNEFALAATLESLFDVDLSKVDLRSSIAAVDSITEEVQGQMRNPLRTLQFKLFPRCEVRARATGLPNCVLCLAVEP